MVQFSSEDESATKADGESVGGGVADIASGGGGDGSDNRPGVFTVESANRLLPLVSRIAEDLVSLSRNLELEAAQIHGIERLPRKSDIRSFTEELECVKEAFRAENERLSELQGELGQLGVLIDSLQHGAFDFPAFRDRHPIRLCWRIGEPAVMYWHGVGESCQDRRPIQES